MNQQPKTNPKENKPREVKKEDVREDAITEIIKKSQELSKDWLERDTGRPIPEEKTSTPKTTDKKDVKAYEGIFSIKGTIL